MPTLTDLLAAPNVQAVLAMLAEAAAPDAMPQDRSDMARAMATIERDKQAAAIRAALETLGQTPAILDRAAWLERQARPETAREPKTPASGQTPPQDTETRQDETPKPNKRGGKRQGAGRKPSADAADKATGKMIALYPSEWERLDALAADMNTNRSGVIRAALDALERAREQAPGSP